MELLRRQMELELQKADMELKNCGNVMPRFLVVPKYESTRIYFSLEGLNIEDAAERQSITNFARMCVLAHDPLLVMFICSSQGAVIDRELSAEQEELALIDLRKDSSCGGVLVVAETEQEKYTGFVPIIFGLQGLCLDRRGGIFALSADCNNTFGPVFSPYLTTELLMNGREIYRQMINEVTSVICDTSRTNGEMEGRLLHWGRK